MSWIKKDHATSSEEKADKKPAATFWDDPAPAPSSGKHSKVEECGTIRHDPNLELQTSIVGSSREYGQQAINARQDANAQPTSRSKIEHAMRPRSSIYDDGLFHLSTLRAARGEGVISEAERESLIERAERKAWDSFTRMLELFAR